MTFFTYNTHANTNTNTTHFRLPHLPSNPSLSRSSAAVRSLKKIPSSFFNKDASRSPPRTTGPAAPIIEEQPSKSARFFPSPKRTVKETSKPKTKTRKALSEIFGWGSSHAQSAAQAPPFPPTAPAKPYISAPIALAAPVPALKEPAMPAVLKKHPSRQLSGKSSRSAISGRTSFSISQGVVQTRARPSMGEDPFSRREQGAQVVDVVLRHGVAPSVRSSTYSGMSERRSSVGSSKALSGSTLIDEEEDATILVPSAAASSILSMPLDAARPLSALPQQRPLSVPLTSRRMDEPQPRSASLGRIIEADLPSPSRSAVSSLESRSDKSDHVKAIRKEKTRSKVWGIFGGGRRKDKKDKAEASPEPKPRHAFEVRPVEAPFGSYASRSRSTYWSMSNASTISAHHAQRSGTGAIRSVSSISPSGTAQPASYFRRPFSDAALSAAGKTRRTPRKPVPPIDERFEDAPSPSSPPGLHGPRWSVAGSIPERPSVEGPREKIVATKTTVKHDLPKRKSLSGLFGLALKRSIDRLRHQGSRSSLKVDEGTLRLPPAGFNGNTLRSLAEEMEKAEMGGVKAVSSPYRSRFNGEHEQRAPSTMPITDLQGVAIATDRLSALVMLDFSPAMPTPSDHASPLVPPSLASLDDDGSPTPMRRTRSAVLTSRKSASSPLRDALSPLKLALHRSQAASQGQSASLGKTSKHIFARDRPAMTGSPLKTSMVRKGMRNIFAPPTPPRDPTTLDAQPPSAAPIIDETVGMGRTMGPDVIPARIVRADMPADLQAILGNGNGNLLAPSSPVKKSMLGLPPLPPPDRVSPRRANGRAPPPISLPPVPEFSPKSQIERISLVPPQLTLDLADDDTASILSEVLDSTGRHSFDFTGEYANLDRGEHRASFIEALKQAPAGQQLPSSPPPLNLVHAGDLSHIMEEDEEPTDIWGRREEIDDEEDDDEDLAKEIATARVQRTPRPAPFKGQPAFQAHVAQFKISPPKSLLEVGTALAEPALIEKKPSQPFAFVSQRATLDLPQGRRRQHRQDEAGVSIASMSSIGSVIETGIAGDYTNYFDVNFKNQSHGHARGSSADKAMPHQRSQDAIGRSHHRRSSSVISVESIQEDLASVIAGMGPPVSMHNARRSGYISRHRRGASGAFGSGDSVSFGRSDWAAHKRSSSIESTSSTSSIVRLGRPGLRDRMFNLDGGVQLTSITGSPADGMGGPEAPTPVPDRTQQHFSARSAVLKPSADSLLGPAEYSRDSIFNSTAEMTRDDSLFRAPADQSRMDSIFNSSAEMSRADSIFDRRSHAVSSSIESDSFFSGMDPARGHRFMLKGLKPRPESMMSSKTDGSGDSGENTVHQYGCSPMPKGQVACHEADGEDSTMTRSLAASLSNGQMVQSQSIPRPAKPRRRQAGPRHLAFKHPSLASQSDVPTLSSPSASEASSRLSLDSKMSDAGSLFGSVGRATGAGHLRQKSSVGVKVQATIKEEPSNATLRGAARTRQSRAEPRVVDWDEDATPPETVRSWNEWKREADEEFRRMRSYAGEGDEGKDSIQHFKLPMTLADINAFIAQSYQTYRPLEQVLPARRTAHRHKSSLSDARQMLSPYGLPLPKPPAPPGEAKPKKVSLQTKYERTQKSSTSSYFTIASDEAGTSGSSISTPSRPPLSAMFAQFVVPPSPAPVSADLPFSAFMPQPDGSRAATSHPSTGMKDEAHAATERPRVNSGARRAALGWGRRRNSDGPTKVEQMARVYEQVTAASRAHEVATLSLSALPMKPRPGSESVVPQSRMVPSPLARELTDTEPSLATTSVVTTTQAASQKKSEPMLAPKAKRPALTNIVNGSHAASGPSTGVKIKAAIKSRSTDSQRNEGKISASVYRCREDAELTSRSKVLRPKASGRKVVPKRSVHAAAPARALRA